MSVSERSPKRQRGEGSFSPASPPYHLTKQDVQTKPFVSHPQTPPSPSHMSSATYHGSPQYHQAFPTPPSTAGLSNHMPNSSLRGSVEPAGNPQNTSQNTPVSIVRDGDMDVHMQHGTDASAREDTVMIDAHDYRRSDHEREGEQEGGTGSQSSARRSEPLQLLLQMRKAPKPDLCIPQNTPTFCCCAWLT